MAEIAVFQFGLLYRSLVPREKELDYPFILHRNIPLSQIFFLHSDRAIDVVHEQNDRASDRQPLADADVFQCYPQRIANNHGKHAENRLHSGDTRKHFLLFVIIAVFQSHYAGYEHSHVIDKRKSKPRGSRKTVTQNDKAFKDQAVSRNGDHKHTSISDDVFHNIAFPLLKTNREDFIKLMLDKNIVIKGCEKYDLR